MAEALTVKSLSGGYGPQLVLHNIDLELEQGSLTAMIGPNGHGKSTLMRAISGLLPCCHGEIRLLGEAIDRMAPHLRVAHGLVHIPQGDLLFTEMSVEDNLRCGGYLRNKREVRHALEEVYGLFPKLAERRKQKAGTLSGGERRMVGIGRGLVQDGAVLLVDEPSLGLAPTVIDIIYEALARVAGGGRTILLVEESPVRILGIAKQVALLDDGRIVWRGTPSEMRSNSSLLNTYLGGA